MTKIPPYLKKGDTIGLIAPAGYMPTEKFQQCMQTLQDWGYRVLPGKTPGHQFYYFAGTDDERIEDLQTMLDNPEVRAILCVRGGYGVGRIIDQINFKKFRKHPKWVIGFSDITVLLSHIFTNYNIATLHAPMAAAFNDEGWKDEYVGSLRKALKGTLGNYKVHTDAYSQQGHAEGVLVGGNLALLTHLIGTSSDLDTRDKILFIEDIGEYIYSVDRMLIQLKRSGKLDKLKGLIVGSFNDMKDTDIPFGMDTKDVIKSMITQYDFPVAFGFPVGHETENVALKVGVKYSLRVAKNTTTLKEMSE